MIRVSGTVNQIPVKTRRIDEFISLLNKARIPYKYAGSLTGYFIYQFDDEADTLEATYLRDTLYKPNKI